MNISDIAGRAARVLGLRADQARALQAAATTPAVQRAIEEGEQRRHHARARAAMLLAGIGERDAKRIAEAAAAKRRAEEKVAAARAALAAAESEASAAAATLTGIGHAQLQESGRLERLLRATADPGLATIAEAADALFGRVRHLDPTPGVDRDAHRAQAAFRDELLATLRDVRARALTAQVTAPVPDELAAQMNDMVAALNRVSRDAGLGISITFEDGRVTTVTMQPENHDAEAELAAIGEAATKGNDMTEIEIQRALWQASAHEAAHAVAAEHFTRRAANITLQRHDGSGITWFKGACSHAVAEEPAARVIIALAGPVAEVLATPHTQHLVGTPFLRAVAACTSTSDAESVGRQIERADIGAAEAFVRGNWPAIERRAEAEIQRFLGAARASAPKPAAAAAAAPATLTRRTGATPSRQMSAIEAAVDVDDSTFMARMAHGLSRLMGARPERPGYYAIAPTGDVEFVAVHGA